MSEMDRAPSIRLEVDQEIFVDTVREGDTVEDATVATEVTSFERVGDAYVLEGAIVFAGYIARDGEQTGTPDEEDDALGFDFGDDAGGQHVHQRLPFVLRVPCKVQPRGIVNVASRISGWELAVVSAGWLRITADLQVVGLNGDQGYHFQCGTQESGDVFFEGDFKGFQADFQSDFHGTFPVQEEAAEPEEAFELTRNDGHGDADIHHAENRTESTEFQALDGASVGPADVVSATRDAVSLARGGHGEVEPAGTQDDDAPSVRSDLFNYDRAFGGEPSREPSQADEDITVNIRHEGSADDVQVSESNAKAEDATAPLAEFEFVDQVSQTELREQTSDLRNESFVPSRSFNEDGFQPTSGFVKESLRNSDAAAPVGEERVLGETPPAGKAAADTRTVSNEGDDTNEAGETATVVFRSEGGDDSENENLWSFVDFHAPETQYTLRFVVVSEEESLESIAERCGCKKSELVRMNRLTQESVSAGQMLMVP